MRKISPYVPIIGVILVLYYSIIEEKSPIDESVMVFWSSALVQALSYIGLYYLIYNF